MSDITKLLDEISDLEREINDHAKHIRLNVVTELLRNPEFGYSTDKIIADAARIARFVERGSVGDYASDRVFDGTRPIKPKKVKKLSENHSRTHGKPKAKRPYVKRSKFWKKK